jgi:hypothetical protein
MFVTTHISSVPSGEQFRHQQNLSRSRDHLRHAATRIVTGPTLPHTLIFDGNGSGHSEPEPASRTRTFAALPPSSLALKPPAGPAAPKSWLARAADAASAEGAPPWRAAALAPIFSMLPAPRSAAASLLPGWDYRAPVPRVPPLAQLCLRSLRGYLDECADEFMEDALPFLASHLRRDLVRDAAIRAPLDTRRLQALYSPVGHAEGEIIVIGPHAVLKQEWLGRPDTDLHLASQAAALHVSDHGAAVESWDQDDSNWDEDDADGSTLHTLIVLSVRLSASVIPQLPPTLTILALVSVPASLPLPIHRLPRLCPRLVALDLSFNAAWLDNKLLARVEWSRWRDLSFLGLRECDVTADALANVNEGRWTDVDIAL